MALRSIQVNSQQDNKSHGGETTKSPVEYVSMNKHERRRVAVRDGISKGV